MDTTAATDPLLLPEASCLLHIGPPKTGTTSLQAAFWAAREAALAQGVRYAGWSRHTGEAVTAVARFTPVPGVDEPPTIRLWRDLANEVRRAREPRVVLSSEFFSYATDAAARRIVGDLEPARAHVVVTLRPLARILPSAWQQYVKNGLRIGYDAWLEAMLNGSPDGVTPLFWQQERHDALVARWAGVVGAGRVTVVVADDRDHGWLLRTFERLTGLREGTLTRVADLANRSLTRAEVEAIRALNERARAEGFTPLRIDRIVRADAARYLMTRVPDPAEPRISTPQWALDRAGEIAREMVAGIATSGVRVVGDLAALTSVPESRPEPGPEADAPLSPEIAAWLAMGMYRAGHRSLDVDLDRVAATRLASALVRRVRRAATRRLRMLRH
ncbi:MAG: hypothetical protein A2V85_15730 [Chloroflexi bacterium RBG_16_72_14]|nr:MAG: hypothetical protein A2V85_15730 [Chloroflexi bacterium RBG_16_72_14]